MELKAKWMGIPWNWTEEMDSTNEWAKRDAKNGAPSGAVYIADSQTQGKGRIGRRWETPKGSSLALSLLLRPDFEAEHAPMLTLIMGMAACMAIEKITGLTAEIKWPNDVVINKKKTTGILTEMGMSEGKISYVVVGIGINLNMESFPEELAYKATSLKIECGHEINRDEIAAALLFYFEQYYEKFEQTYNLGFLIEEYNNHLVNRGKEVLIKEKDGEYTGISRGINDKGELLVEKKDGNCVEIFSGEVSVRGLYGYV